MSSNAKYFNVIVVGLILVINSAIGMNHSGLEVENSYEQQMQGYLNRELVIAVMNGDREKAVEFKKRGGDINVVDSQHTQTALQWAVQDNLLGMAKLALELGADVNVVRKVGNDQGNTPLHDAIQLNILALVELLLNHRADVNAKNAEGNTPLMEILKFPSPTNLAIAKLLLAHGADIHEVNKYGRTALFTARNKEGVFEVLCTIPTDEKAKIIMHKESVLAVRFAQPRMPKDVYKLVNQQIIKVLAQEQMDRVQQLIAVRENRTNFTAFESCMNDVQTSALAIDMHQLEVASLILNPDSRFNSIYESKIRARIEYEIKKLLFGEPKRVIEQSEDANIQIVQAIVDTYNNIRNSVD